MRDSFTFYRSFMEAIDDADPETYKRLMRAITHYAMDGIEPEGLDVLERGLFISWKANVDASNRRKDNGLKGGRPKKAEKEKTSGFDDENRNVSRLSDEKPNKKEKENKNDKENEKEKEKDVDSISPLTPLPVERDWNKHTNLDNAEHILNNGYEKADYIQRHEALKDCIREWMQYKDAKKPRSSNHYANERSITALLNKFVENSEKYGERAVIDVVNDSLAAGYQGIIWDKVKAYNARSGTTGKIDWSMV